MDSRRLRRDCRKEHRASDDEIYFAAADSTACGKFHAKDLPLGFRHRKAGLWWVFELPRRYNLMKSNAWTQDPVAEISASISAKPIDVYFVCHRCLANGVVNAAAGNPGSGSQFSEILGEAEAGLFIEFLSISVNAFLPERSRDSFARAMTESVACWIRDRYLRSQNLYPQSLEEEFREFGEVVFGGRDAEKFHRLYDEAESSRRSLDRLIAALFEKFHDPTEGRGARANAVHAVAIATLPFARFRKVKAALNPSEEIKRWTEAVDHRLKGLQKGTRSL